MEVEDFIRLSGMRHTAFGIEVMKDPSFVTRLRKKDTDVKAKTIERVRKWMEDNHHLLRQEAASQ